MDRQRAFSLIELSVVLAVLGLLAGAVVAGRSVIEAATLRGIARDGENYAKAVGLFKQKYNALPGDFAGAVALWGSDPHGCPRPYNASNINDKPNGTCDGDGNGHIQFSNSEELYRGWQHMKNAAMIDAQVAGGVGLGGNAQIGYNVPESPKRNGAYSLAHKVVTYNLNHRNEVMILFGAAAGALTNNGAITPGQAQNIDQKNDDGNPSTGNVISFSDFGVGTCQIDAGSGMYVYNTASATNACALLFATGQQ